MTDDIERLANIFNREDNIELLAESDSFISEIVENYERKIRQKKKNVSKPKVLTREKPRIRIRSLIIEKFDLINQNPQFFTPTGKRNILRYYFILEDNEFSRLVDEIVRNRSILPDQRFLQILNQDTFILMKRELEKIGLTVAPRTDPLEEAMGRLGVGSRDLSSLSYRPPELPLEPGLLRQLEGLGVSSKKSKQTEDVIMFGRKKHTTKKHVTKKHVTKKHGNKRLASFGSFFH